MSSVRVMMSEGSPTAIAGERNAFSNPDDAAVLLQAAFFNNVVVDFSGQHLPAELGITRAVFGMRDGVGIDLGQFLPGEAENVTKGAIYLEKTALCVGKRHTDSGLRKGFAEALLTGAKIQPSLFSLGCQAVFSPSCAYHCWIGLGLGTLPWSHC